MSTQAKVRLYCDATGCQASVDTSERTVTAAIRTAARWGWTRPRPSRALDLCPEHGGPPAIGDELASDWGRYPPDDSGAADS